MQLQPVTWKCEGNKNHVVMEVVFEAGHIASARQVADAKAGHINVHNPGGIHRSPEVIRSRIIAGKLADAAVAELLQKHTKQAGLEQTHSVDEYDKSRTDGFQNPDPFDLELHKPGGRTETIEVRSSFCYLLAPPNKIVQKLSVYGWYTSMNKAKESPRDWYWQVIYYLRPRDISVDNNAPYVGVFEEALDTGAVRAYIVGGASEGLLKTAGGTRKDQDGAYYQAISPICHALDCEKLLAAMFPGGVA